MRCGKWLRLTGQTAKAVLVILGNPLIARTMLQYDIRIGLNVPVRLLIYEHKDGSTRVAYDLPSSLMGDLENSDVSKAAVKLDAKLIARPRQELALAPKVDLTFKGVVCSR